MKVGVFVSALIILFSLLPSVSAELIFDYTLHEPPNGFSVENNTLINYTACVTDNVTNYVNGTPCITVDIENDIGACVGESSGGLVCIEAFYRPINIGSFFWRANWTNATDSYVMYSETRNYNVIITDETLVPIYPVDSETVIGDNTNFIVNYTVDLYLPEDLTYPLYIHFYAYSSYLGSPLFSSEKKICSIEVEANETNPKRTGLHRFGCENYMYDTYYINYHELPDEHFWRAKLKILDEEIEGANLLSDTSFQRYNYQINTNLAHIYPPDEAVYCDQLIYFFNGTFYNLAVPCNYQSWQNQFIPFYSYLRDDGCNGGNLTWNYRNAVNTSDSGQSILGGIPNNTEDYFDIGIQINPNAQNTTYTGATGQDYTAIHMVHNWTYDCNNGTTYTTSDNDFWYIIGIGAINVTNVTVGYPTYPLSIINQSAIMPSFAVYWSSFFQTTQAGGLFLIALFFILVMAILVTLNSDIIGGGGVAIIGIMVFTRIGYIPLWVMFLMLTISGLVVVYMIRRTILSR